MKISFYGFTMLLITAQLLMADISGAQDIKKTNVTLELNNSSLKTALRILEKESGFNIFYLSSKVAPYNGITLKRESRSVQKTLELILQNTQLVFRQEERNIILTESRQVINEEAKKPPLSGKVTDKDGQGLPGVSVILMGTTQGTITDETGSYQLLLPGDNATLIFSFVGYVTQQVPVNGKTSLDIVLKVDEKSLEEVVVVGYGAQKKVNLTGAVSSVSASEIENRPITQSSQALAGLVSGVTVSQSSGRPGNDQSSITIRGLGTFSGAGNSPLVLVDGLASSINDVDPNNIKSISVLKDAASASIYGTRAANGVILIETKRGSQSKLQVGYNSYIGWQSVTQLPQFLESADYALMRNEANANMGQGRAYTDEEIEKFRNGSDPDKYPNVPHLKNLVNSGSGFQTNHNLNFTGGDGKNSFLFSLGYLKQDGIVAKNHYNKYNFLLNFDSKIKSNLTLKVNLAGNAANTDEPRQYDGEMMNMIGFAVRQGPIFAGKKSDGTYGYQDNYSPEAWLASESFVNRKNKYFLGGAELAWEIVDGLTLSGKAGYNYANYTNTSYAANFTFDQFKTVGPNNLSVQSGDNGLLTLQSLLRYEKQFGKHSISALGGFSQESFREDWTRGYRQNFPNNSLYELNAGSATGMTATGSGSEWALRSYFGRVNYSFNEKYLFEANARYDGTSRFPEKGRWGLFPSFSAGWRVSEEAFIKDNISWIDNLKLRASWGKLGNQNVGNYPYQNLLSLGRNYTFGGTLSSGAAVTTLANANISWEKTQITDIGLDLNILKGKLGLVVDYFSKTTSDILYNISVSQVLGLNTSEVNAGAVKNTGVEILVNYNTRIGNVNIGVVPNFSYVKNRVTKLANGIQQDIGNRRFVGQPLNAIYGYEADGLFTSTDDIAAYPTQPYSAQPGFVRYKDISGPDGVPDGKVDATYDQKVIGSTFPKYSFGATLNADYKGFDFSVLFQGLAGFKKQMGSYQAFAFYNGGQIQQWQADGRWTEQNPDRNAEYPKLTSLNMGSGTLMTSTFWNRSADFVRMKNIQIGYSLPGSVTEKLKISRLRLFFSGQNLFSFNHFYKGWDPEMNQNTGDSSPFYPITGVYTFGVNVKF